MAGGTLVKHSCDSTRHSLWSPDRWGSVFPAGTGSRWLRQGCRELLGQNPCDSMNEALPDFLDSGLDVVKEELQSSWRKAESLQNLQV